MRKAVACHACFACPGATLQRTSVKLAQPRPIGQGYWTVGRRVVFVGLNPSQRLDTELNDLLVAYEAGKVTREAVDQRYLRKKPGAYRQGLTRYLCALGLKLDDVALANIAWCSTMTNKYPPDMLNRCFATHTRALLADLNPDVIILTGAATRPFIKPIKKAFSHALVVQTWHCSNREKRVDEAAKLAKIKALMDEHQPCRPSRFAGTAESVKPIGRWIREEIVTKLT
jgi:Uracil DNA glycosylase superfamily